jgi:hypothetical protein
VIFLFLKGIKFVYRRFFAFVVRASSESFLFQLVNFATDVG